MIERLPLGERVMLSEPPPVYVTVRLLAALVAAKAAGTPLGEPCAMSAVTWLMFALVQLCGRHCWLLSGWLERVVEKGRAQPTAHSKDESGVGRRASEQVGRGGQRGI